MVTAHWLATDLLLIADMAQQEALLRDAAAGRILGAFALTEPNAGSNPAEMTTRAVRDEGGYHITGTKQFISNAGEADFLVVYAKTDMAAGSRGISAFLVERRSEEWLSRRAAGAHDGTEGWPRVRGGA